jgi:hypothetical protein
MFNADQVCVPVGEGNVNECIILTVCNLCRLCWYWQSLFYASFCRATWTVSWRKMTVFCSYLLCMEARYWCSLWCIPAKRRVSSDCFIPLPLLQHLLCFYDPWICACHMKGWCVQKLLKKLLQEMFKMVSKLLLWWAVLVSSEICIFLTWYWTLVLMLLAKLESCECSEYRALAVLSCRFLVLAITAILTLPSERNTVRKD